jgi:hypothetical protein
MLGRSVVVIAAVIAAMPAWAGELKPEEAKRFIAGKYFSYTCFEGTTGAGRINADGSVAGTIQMRGSGAVHLVALPTGTIRVQPDSICASLLGFAYCDFTRRNPRLEISSSPSVHPSRPIDWGMLRTSVDE